MNLQKFTQKSLEAIQNAQSNAVEYGNPQLDQQHLLLALLQQEDGLIPGLLQKMNINVNGLTQAVENEVNGCLVSAAAKQELRLIWKRH